MFVEGKDYVITFGVATPIGQQAKSAFAAMTKAINQAAASYKFGGPLFPIPADGVLTSKQLNGFNQIQEWRAHQLALKGKIVPPALATDIGQLASQAVELTRQFNAAGGGFLGLSKTELLILGAGAAILVILIK